MFAYTLRQIEYFVAAAETGTISEAAGRCHISQAGLSQALSELERAIGTDLTVRRRAKGVTLTPAGKEFLPEARRLLDRARELETAASLARGRLTGRLLVGCLSSSAPFIIPPLLAGVREEHPELALEFSDGNPEELQHELLLGHFDAVFVDAGHLLPGVDHLTIQRRWAHALLPPAWPEASLELLTAQDLAGKPMALQDLPAVRDELLPALAAAGLQPDIRYRFTNLEIVRGVVGRGLAYAVLLHSPTNNVTYEGLTVVRRPFTPAIGIGDVVLGIPAARPAPRRVEWLQRYCRQIFPLHGRGAPSALPRYRRPDSPTP